MRIAVIGAGGVGGYFGGRLAEAGEDVTFLARGRTLEALRTNGLRIRSPLGDAAIEPVSVAEDPAEVGPADLVILGVKAWQVPDVARTLGPMIGEGTSILPLQNGVEAPDQLIEVLGAGPVLGGLCKIISKIEKPGVIQHIGTEPFIEFGELDSRPSARVQAIHAALQHAGITVRISGDIRAAMWLKFLFIASVSGVGAVTRVPIGTFRQIPETRAMLRQAMEEIRDVGLARGLELPSGCVDATLHFVDGLPESGTASMQRDLMDGSPSELDSQNGAVVRLAEAAGVAVPVNTFLYHALLPSERLARATA